MKFSTVSDSPPAQAILTYEEYAKGQAVVNALAHAVEELREEVKKLHAVVDATIDNIIVDAPTQGGAQ
jgi:hypothetical protein